jgi:hypothetical protein
LILRFIYFILTKNEKELHFEGKTRYLSLPDGSFHEIGNVIEACEERQANRGGTL